MNKESQLIWEAYTNKQINEHHASEWPRSVLNMSVRELLDKLKDEEQVEGELYAELEDFIKTHWKADFEENQDDAESWRPADMRNIPSSERRPKMKYSQSSREVDKRDRGGPDTISPMDY